MKNNGLGIYGNLGEKSLGVQYNGESRSFSDIETMCRYVLSAAPSFITVSLNIRHGSPLELKRFFERNSIPAELVD